MSGNAEISVNKSKGLVVKLKFLKLISSLINSFFFINLRQKINKIELIVENVSRSLKFLYFKTIKCIKFFLFLQKYLC